MHIFTRKEQNNTLEISVDNFCRFIKLKGLKNQPLKITSMEYFPLMSERILPIESRCNCI